MEIKNLGGRTVLIKTKKETAIINPTEKNAEKDRPRVVIYTEQTVEVDGAEGNRVVIAGPGEYEVGGIEINGFSGGPGSYFYEITADGVKVAIVGKLKERLTDKRVEKIEGIDVVMAEIKGSAMKPKEVLELAKKWGANYVVPVGCGENGDLKNFLDEADAEGQEPIESLKVDINNLPDGTEVVILKESK